MDAGKAASQAAHAARLSLCHYLQHNPSHLTEFIEKNSAGSLVVLEAPGLDDLDILSIKASRRNLPWALFIDSEHVMLPSFDGSPIPTALAIGPAAKPRMKSLVRHYPPLKAIHL